MKKISASELKTLIVVGTKGAKRVAIGLESLLNQPVAVANPKLQLLPLSDVADFLGGAERIVSAVYLSFEGAMQGGVVMIFPEEQALALINTIKQPVQATVGELDEYDQSILKEVTNICAGAYLNELARIIQGKIEYSTPFLATDLLGAILDQVLSPIAMEADQALLIETDFSINKVSANGFLLLLPQLADLNKILDQST